MYKQISSCHTQHGGAPSCDTAPFRHLPSTNCMLNNVKNNSYPWTKYSLCFILSSVSLSLSSFNLPLTLYLSSSSSLSLSHTPSPPQLHPHSIKIASVGVVIFFNLISSPTGKKIHQKRPVVGLRPSKPINSMCSSAVWQAGSVVDVSIPHQMCCIPLFQVFPIQTLVLMYPTCAPNHAIQYKRGIHY